MKILKQFNGGRKRSANDLFALQEQIQKGTSHYANKGAFVLQGCTVSGTQISSGVVIINNQICTFSGAANVTFPVYMRQATPMETDLLPDASGQVEAHYTVYNAELVTVAPTGEHITFTAQGGRSYTDVLRTDLVDKASAQTVAGSKTFTAKILANADVEFNSISLSSLNTAKADASSVTTALNLKADKTYVDAQLLPKASITYVDSSITTRAEAKLPVGTVTMWSGSTANFDGTGKGTGALSGWALCNGQNGTLDLRGRFIVGFDPSKPATPSTTSATTENYGAIGNKGGLNTVTLTESQMPIHSHTVTGELMQKSGDTTKTVYALDTGADYMGGTKSFTTGTAGSGFAHENRPAYAVLAYIQKIA